MDKISVIIPVYKNKQLFLANLKHNLPFLKGTEIVIVNDDPSERIGLKSVINFSGVVINNQKNLGFGGAVNQGVKKSSRPYLLLLNSDIILNDQSFLRGLKYFKEDKKTFAVSFLQKDGKVLVGKNIFFWSEGMFSHKRVGDLRNGFNGWAEGGSCLINKNKFLRLGGFDEIYAPFYWEDIDLSYRAWKTGWRIYFSREIKVNHHHESTIGKYFDRSQINKIATRNQLIFIWKNIGDKRLLFSHCLYLSRYFFKALIYNNKIFLDGFFSALKKLPFILKKRRKEKEKFFLSDRQILVLLNKKGDSEIVESMNEDGQN